jgi:hypothetical protein
MHLEASTLYTKEKLKHFVWFSFSPRRKSRQKVRAMLITYPILVVLMLGLTLLSDLDSLILALAVLLAFITLFLYLMLLYVPHMQYKKMKDRMADPIEYVFLDDHFTVHSDGPLVSGDTKAIYEALFKAFETDDFFYLFIEPQRAFIVGKSDFSLGQPDELRARLRQALGKKFKERTSAKAG